MDEIPLTAAGGLYISDIDTVAEESLPDGTDTVISTCQDTVRDNVPSEISYRHHTLADDMQSVERWGGSCDYPTFARAATDIKSALQRGETVVVHCHKGRNRSVATSAAAIGVVEGDAPSEIIVRIQQHREIADPNDLMRSHAETYCRALTP